MGYLKINGVRIYYKKPLIKRKKKDDLVFLHGYIVDISSYKQLLRILRKKYNVYAFDWPMHGKSGIPDKYLSLLDFEKILVEFIKRLKIKKPVIFAHSASSLVAFDYALKKSVKELILVDPMGVKFPKSEFEVLVQLLLKNPTRGFLKQHKNYFGIFKDAFYNVSRNLFNKNYWQLISDNFDKNYTRKMNKIKIPVKIYWGMYDEIFPFSYSKKFKKNLRDCEIVPIDGSHSWLSICPEKIEEKI